jgi:hypothetical protein
MNRLIISLIGLCVLFSSCSDTLELKPKNSVTFYNFFNTEKDLEVAVASMHDMLRADYMSGNNYPAIFGALTDRSSADIKALRDWEPTAFNGLSVNDWNSHYDIISWAHVIMGNIDQIEGLSQDRYDFYYGQALFVRAFIYFRLVQTWGDVPFVKDMLDNGPKAKTAWKEVLDVAIEDAKKAAELLKPWAEQQDANGGGLKTKQIPGKGTAYALLAHMHAWKAGFGGDIEHYDLAIEAATHVIEDGEFALVSDPEAVVTEVMYGGSSESIFDGDFTYEELGGNQDRLRHFESFYQSWPFRDGKAKSDVKKTIFGLRNTTIRNMYTDGDKRRDAYFYQFEALENDPILQGWSVMQKRRESIISTATGQVQFRNWEGDAIVFRLAGIILLRAECYARNGESGNAITDLNTVRARAGASLYSAVEGELNYTIFKEREKELITEQHRWFDCLRTGFWKTELSDRIGAFTEDEIDNGAFFLPVSGRAFRNNSLMKQNTYWLGKW